MIWPFSIAARRGYEQAVVDLRTTGNGQRWCGYCGGACAWCHSQDRAPMYSAAIGAVQEEFDERGLGEADLIVRVIVDAALAVALGGKGER